MFDVSRDRGAAGRSSAYTLSSSSLILIYDAVFLALVSWRVRLFRSLPFGASACLPGLCVRVLPNAFLHAVCSSHAPLLLCGRYCARPSIYPLHAAWQESGLEFELSTDTVTVPARTALQATSESEEPLPPVVFERADNGSKVEETNSNDLAKLDADIEEPAHDSISLHQRWSNAIITLGDKFGQVSGTCCHH